MIKLADLLEEGIFDMFKSKPQQQQPVRQPQQQQPPAPRPKSDYIVDGLPITVEGVADDGNGYQIFKGSDPVGDLRVTPEIQGGETVLGTRTYKGVEYVYYAIGYAKDQIYDRVGRAAYFSVSTRAEGDVEAIKAKLKKIGDEIYHKVLVKDIAASKIDARKAKNL